MPVPTARFSNALSKDSRFVITNQSAVYARVASVTASTIVADSLSDLTGLSLYAASTPGLVSITTGQGATDNGLVGNITGVSGSTLTVDVDPTAIGSAPALADGDIVCVVPPHSLEFSPTSGGFSLDVTAPNEATKGLQDFFLTHNTPDTIDVGGNVTSFINSDTLGFARLLGMTLDGYYKSGTGIHDFVFMPDDDGNYAEVPHSTIYAKSGNAVVEEVFGGLLGSSATISIPQQGPATLSTDLTGDLYTREVGGAGKTFPTGASNYVVDALGCDNGLRKTAIAAFIEFGGSFGSALTDAQQAGVRDLTVTLSREVTNPRPVGSPYSSRAEAVGGDVTITGSRILDDNDLHDDFMGGTSDAQGQKTETRAFIRMINPVTTARTIDIDCPLGTLTTTRSQDRGHIMENFTFTAHHTLDGNDCPDTANPLVRVRIDNGVDTDIIAAL